MFGHALESWRQIRMMIATREDGFMLENLASLSSGGPNVNKTIFRYVESKVITITLD